MTNVEERLFMLDLAIVQLIAGILVTLGSTLLAISIGFGLTIPEAMQDVVLQMLVMKTGVSQEVQQVLIQESLSNYVFVLAGVSLTLILIGVLFASAKTSKIRKEIKAKRKIADLISTDIHKSETISRHLRQDIDDSITNQSPLSDELALEKPDKILQPK